MPVTPWCGDWSFPTHPTPAMSSVDPQYGLGTMKPVYQLAGYRLHFIFQWISEPISLTSLFDKRKAWLHLEMKWRLGNALVFGSLCSHVAAWIYLLRAQYRPVAGFYDRMLADRLLLIKLRAHDDADTFYAERRETLMAQDHDTFQ